jgi:ABC-type Fe3+ transport system substrate-binding protein
MFKNPNRRSLLISLAMIGLALALTYAPLPGIDRQLIVVSGTELQSVLTGLQSKFEQQHPGIRLELKFQGSQDIVNNFIDDKNEFTPAVLIPANGELLQELTQRWQAQTNTDPFYDPPRSIAKTLLVAIAWQDRGRTLFPAGQFQWTRLEQALKAGNLQAIGSSSDWGSFDLLITDPTRSNSAQLALYLWAADKLGATRPSLSQLNQPEIQALFGLIRRSVYQPPRSSDILLQEFIARGANDADLALVYESIALSRWQQSQVSQGQPYQIYYLDPSVESISTAAIPRRGVDSAQADAARTFLDFLTQPEQQAAFVQQGFRPVGSGLDLATVANSPWQQNIPGVKTQPTGKTLPAPDRQILTEIIRLWQRAN